MATKLAVAPLACEQMKSLFDLFLAARLAHGSRPAVWVEGATITYDQLYTRAAHLAGVIRSARNERTPSQGPQCGLLVNRTPTAYAAVLASLMTGSAYVPLNPTFPTERLREIVAASDIDTIIVDDRSVSAAVQLLEHLPRALTILLPDTNDRDAWRTRTSEHRYVVQSDIERAAPATSGAECTLDEGAYLLFTSGSTGTPKGVLITHRNALAYVKGVFERYRPGPTDRFSQLFDFSFDLSVHDMFLAWASGACLYCAPEGSLMGIGNFIRRSELTFWLSVPATAAYMRQMRMLKPGAYPTLRWSLFCGEALPMDLARVWQDAAPNSHVENLYGPTEATIAFTTYRLPTEPCAELDTLATVPIGMPLPGQKVILIGEDGKPVQDGQSGEICLGGSQVAMGYWRAQDRSAERFRSPDCAEAAGVRWYRTGDLGVMSRKHGIVFRGRIDRQIKIRGYRVELLEVENAMRHAAETDMVGAVAWPIGEGGIAFGIVGFVASSQISPLDIIDRCRVSLPVYMVPSQIYQVDNWPLNANGKTDYKRLTALIKTQTDRINEPERIDTQHCSGALAVTSDSSGAAVGEHGP